MLEDPTDEIGDSSSAEWSRANVGELLPGLVTPLSATMTGRRCETAGRAVWHTLGVFRADEVPIPADVDVRQNAFARGRLCLNLTVLCSIVAKIPGTDVESLERDVIGHAIPTTASAPASAGNWSEKLGIGARSARAAATVGPRVRRLHAETDSWWRRETSNPRTRSLTEGIALMCDADRRFHEILCAGILASMFAQGTYRAVADIAARHGVDGIENSVVSGYEDLDEARLARDLAAVASGAMSRAAFLSRHGYQAGAQYHVSGRSWRESPEQLDAAIAGLQDPAESDSALDHERARHSARAAATRDLLAAQPRRRRPAAQVLLRLVHRFVVLREAQKTSGLQAVDVMRSSARVVGTSLAADGLIDEPDDVQFLTFDEIRSNRFGRARELVALRRERHERHADMELPESWSGAPPTTTPPTTTLPTTGAFDAPRPVTGTGASPGVVEGTALVALDPADGMAAAPGSVLICRTTDPSWTPAFMMTAAVVIDLGGPMSHGAIVARDLGVPCVTGAKDATTRIGSGDRVRVDGAAGTVEILERGRERGGER